VSDEVLAVLRLIARMRQLRATLDPLAHAHERPPVTSQQRASLRELLHCVDELTRGCPPEADLYRQGDGGMVVNPKQIATQPELVLA
jgi:hypothetical protein